MQQRREMDRRQESRLETHRDEAQPRADDEDEQLEKPETVPNFLTAQELQAPEPKQQHDGEKPVGERRVLKERRRGPG